MGQIPIKLFFITIAQCHCPQVVLYRYSRLLWTSLAAATLKLNNGGVNVNPACRLFIALYQTNSCSRSTQRWQTTFVMKCARTHDSGVIAEIHAKTWRQWTSDGYLDKCCRWVFSGRLVHRVLKSWCNQVVNVSNVFSDDSSCECFVGG